MPDAQAKALMESLHERAAIARGEKTGTALGDAIHFERAAAEIDRLTKELEEAREALTAARKFAVNALRAACELPDFDPADHVVVKKIDAALSKATGGQQA